MFIEAGIILTMRTILTGIDLISKWAGTTASWLCPVIVGVITWEVFARYVLNKPTSWAFETSMMLGITFYVWAWAYVQKENAHIRIDVILEHLPLRAKAAINTIGTLLFFPVLVVLTNHAFSMAWRAWEIHERLMMGVWFPPAAPVRTVVALGFFIFALQFFASLIRSSYILVRNKVYD